MSLIVVHCYNRQKLCVTVRLWQFARDSLLVARARCNELRAAPKN